MNLFRYGLFALSLALLTSLTTPAAGAHEKPERGKGKFGDRIGAMKLLPGDAADKLKLSDEQKEKLAKIEKDFAEKIKEGFEKNRDAIKKAFEDGDRDAARKAMEEVRKAGEKIRDEFQEKLAGVLTDEQKKKFEEIKKDAPRFGPGRNGDRPSGDRPSGDRPSGDRPSGTAGPGQVLPRPLQDELKLTDEQKEKLAKIQKDTEAKLMELLTEEQKKKLEELKKGGDRPTRRRPPVEQ